MKKYVYHLICFPFPPSDVASGRLIYRQAGKVALQKPLREGRISGQGVVFRLDRRDRAFLARKLPLFAQFAGRLADGTPFHTREAEVRGRP